MAPTFADGRRWMADGTKLMLEAVSRLDEDGFAQPALLPGWTRKHLAAHLAANADAVGNLIHWAATGIKTPMYASPAERADGIAKGPAMSTQELDSWLGISAERVAEAMGRLTGQQWQQPVLTAQGRTVPAAETPWMRARELCVHAVDFGVGITFADLPDGFNEALCYDIRVKRGLTDLPSEIAGAPLPEVTAWLSGRPHNLTGIPELGPWL